MGIRTGAQYLAGCAEYLLLTKDGRAVPFDSNLRVNVEPLFIELSNLIVHLKDVWRK